MSHSSSDNTGVFYTWYHAYDFYYSSGGKWPWQAATPSNLTTSNYSNWNKTSTVDTFLINDNHHSGYANPTVLYSESGQNDYVFAQGYSNLAIPDVVGSNEFVLNLRSYTDDGFQVWVDRGSGYESVISIRTNHGPRYDYGTITVPDNSVVPVKVEWWEWGGGAILDLQWSPTSAGSSYTRIAEDYLTLSPVFTSSAVTSATEDSLYTYTAVASNIHEDSSHQSMSAVTMPSWLSFNSATGILSGTPDDSAVGSNSITLRVTDSAGFSSEQIFTVTVANIEDEATGTLAITGNVSEGSSLGTSFSPNDSDGSVNVVYQWQVSSDGSNWSDITGATNSSYSIASDQSDVGKYLRITAVTTDPFGGTTSFTSSATSAIANVNDSPVIISDFVSVAAKDVNYSYSFLVTDADPNDSLVLTGELIPSWLEFDTSSGILSGTPTLQNVGSNPVKLIATDSDGSKVEQSFDIDVNNSNQPPTLTSSVSATINENLDQSTVVYSATASDENIQDLLSFSISGQDAEFFTIDTKTGKVLLRSPADYETKSSYSVNLTVRDNGEGNLSDTQAVLFKVADMNDAPSIISPSVAENPIKENSALDIIVYQARARDDDSDDIFTFSIAGDDAEFLSIGSDDGEVRLKSTADYETKLSYTFLVSVQDNGLENKSDSKKVTVNVEDILDSVKENSSIETIVYHTLNDTGISNVVYTLSGSDSAKVSINSFGHVRLLEIPDFETKKVYKFNVNITDMNSGEQLTSNAVELAVIDENDNQPKFSDATFNYDLPLSLSVGSQIATFVAFDKDGDKITYSLKSGNENGLLSIDSSTGLLSTAKPFSSQALVKFWDSSSTAIQTTGFSMVSLDSSSESVIRLVIGASDGFNEVTQPVSLNLPSAMVNESVYTDKSGSIDFENYATGLKYKISSPLSGFKSDEAVTYSDVQAMADYFSGKTDLSITALASADFNESGETNLSDGVKLLGSLIDSADSKIILVDNLGSSELEIWPGDNLDLTAVVLGDVDASYIPLV